MLSHSLEEWTTVNNKADDIAQDLFSQGKVHRPVFDELYKFEKDYVWKIAKGWVE